MVPGGSTRRLHMEQSSNRVRLVNPRGRVVTVSKEVLRRRRLLDKGFHLADEDTVTDYLPQEDQAASRSATIGCQSLSPNRRKGGLRLLIGCLDFSQLTGMPIYYYRLGRQLVKMGCLVTIVAPKVGGEMTQLAKAAGIEVAAYSENRHQAADPEVLLLSETWSERLLDEFSNVPAWYYSHSMYGCDAPLEKRPQIRGYLAPRAQVADYWSKKTGYKIEVIPIPIPLDEFAPVAKKRHKTWRILVPATFNEIRAPMVANLVDRARQDPTIEVFFKGEDFGVLDQHDLPSNCRHEPPSANIRECIAWADEVAGIYVGTVTLEAWAMGREASVYDERGRYKLIKPPKDFEATYGAKVVARQFLDRFLAKWADIIIPHHDQTKLLADCLSSIPLRNYHVLVVRGGTFAENCNKGARLAETEKLVFANDDLVINPPVLWELVDADEELVGVKQYYPNGKPLCLGIFINQFGNYELTSDADKAMYPSGALFKMDRTVFDEVGGV